MKVLGLRVWLSVGKLEYSWEWLLILSDMQKEGSLERAVSNEARQRTVKPIAVAPLRPLR